MSIVRDFQPRKAHQVIFGAATRQPVMRERVPELVGVKIGKSNCAASILDHLVDAARCKSALLAEPEPRIGGAWVGDTHADVPVNVTSGLSADRQDQLTSALCDDPRHARLKVHVRKLGIIGAEPQAAHAFEAHAGIKEEPYDRAVAPIAEILAGAVRQQTPDVIVREHRYWLRRDLGRPPVDRPIGSASGGLAERSG